MQYRVYSVFLLIIFCLLTILYAQSYITHYFHGWMNWAVTITALLVLITGIVNSNRTLRIIGIVGLLVIPIAIAFKIQHWPLGGFLIFCSILTATLAPLISAFVNKKNRAVFLSLYFWVLIHNLGVIFKINHWPSAGLIFILASHSTFIPAIILGAHIFRKTNPQLQTDGNL